MRRLPILGWLVAAFATAIILWQCFPAGADGQTLAAWFQAIGSIAAIFAVILVGKEQAQATLDAVTRAHSIGQHGQRRSILAVAEAAAEHAKRIGDAFSEPDPRIALAFRYDKSIVNGTIQALSSAPTHEVGSRDGVIALLSLRDQFVFLETNMEAYIAGPFADPLLKKAIDSCGDDRKMRQQTIDSGNAGLAKNVKIRLAKIREDYESLERAILGSLAPISTVLGLPGQLEVPEAGSSSSAHKRFRQQFANGWNHDLGTLLAGALISWAVSAYYYRITSIDTQPQLRGVQSLLVIAEEHGLVKLARDARGNITGGRIIELRAGAIDESSATGTLTTAPASSPSAGPRPAPSSSPSDKK
jgi:hypothetical protein